MKRMELSLKRNVRTSEATLGTLSLDDFTMYTTCEDLPHTPKIPGKTRIPAGRYRIKLRRVLSPLTKTYRNKYPWFQWHLELQDVPGFTNIYIHIGNYASNTDGCILVGRNVNVEDSMILSSTDAFEELYGIVSKHLTAGGKAFINIEDYDNES